MSDTDDRAEKGSFRNKNNPPAGFIRRPESTLAILGIGLVHANRYPAKRALCIAMHSSNYSFTPTFFSYSTLLTHV